jgi:hypothetical protein
MTRPAVAPSLRFWRFTVASKGCLLWVGAVNGRGVPVFSVGQEGGKTKFMTAQRYAATLAGLELPEGTIVRTTCANPLCVRAEHLTVVPRTAAKGEP